MQDADTLLAAVLTDWVASLPPGTATLSPLAPTKRGGRRFLVTPTTAGAAAIRLSVGDAADHFTLELGDSARWDHLPLVAETVTKLCASVACGGFLEETWKLGSLTLARRASLVVAGRATLRWGTVSPFLLVPFSRWVRREPKPWLS